MTTEPQPTYHPGGIIPSGLTTLSAETFAPGEEFINGNGEIVAHLDADRRMQPGRGESHSGRGARGVSLRRWCETVPRLAREGNRR